MVVTLPVQSRLAYDLTVTPPVCPKNEAILMASSGNCEDVLNFVVFNATKISLETHQNSLSNPIQSHTCHKFT